MRKVVGRRGWSWWIAPAMVKPVLLATTKPQWEDAEKIPATEGCIVAVNHVTKIDPLTVAHVLYDHGRLPRYLAKDGLFRTRVMGAFLRDAGQIPVQRLTPGAVGAFDAAVEAVKSGECIVVYPEGSITRDPHHWPMRGKSGAARIALATGAPVIPVGHWGEHELLAPYSKVPDLFPRKQVRVKVGDPVDLDDLLAKPVNAQIVDEATDRIMAAITGLVEDLRGQTAPKERFDPRTQGVSEIGKPKRPGRRES